jgi:tetratricopeptide (TPR) repeat protein
MNKDALLRVANAQQVAEKEKAFQQEQEEKMAKIKQDQRNIRQNRLNNNTNDTPGDWTTTYRYFDDWEDPEELAAEAVAARKRREDRNSRQPTSCNHNHTEERKIYEMDWDERLLKCREFQREGNAFYTEGQYQRASIRYHHAITYFEYAIPENDEQQDELDHTKLPVYQNYAACMLKLDRLDDAMNYCEQSLRLNSNSIKALYRKAQVLRKKDQLEEAKTVICQALEIAAKEAADALIGDSDGDNDKAVVVQQKTPLMVELGKIRQKIASYKRNSRKMGAKMFGGKGGKEDSKGLGSEKLSYVDIC